VRDTGRWRLFSELSGTDGTIHARFRSRQPGDAAVRVAAVSLHNDLETRTTDAGAATS
jgi:hypothetical protein